MAERKPEPAPEPDGDEGITGEMEIPAKADEGAVEPPEKQEETE